MLFKTQTVFITTDANECIYHHLKPLNALCPETSFIPSESVSCQWLVPLTICFLRVLTFSQKLTF